MWSMLGFLFSLALALLALTRSRALGGFYDADVYGMTVATHRRYAWVSFGFTVVFAATFLLRAPAVGLWAFAFFTLLAIFYLTSFLRGFSDHDV